MPDLPRFSIIMPVRNEAGHIARAVESIRVQDLDAAFEVIVVDGRSTDGTREAIESWCRSDARVRLLDNPRRITPTALNVAVGASRGDTVVRIDGHWHVPPDYLSRIDAAFRRTGADSVGGRIVRCAADRLGKGIEYARRAALGGGLSERNDPATPAGFVTQSNIATCWRREVMLAVGPFDEGLPKNQDNEFNARLLGRGYTTYYDPSCVFYYATPSDFRLLFRQMFGYARYGLRASSKEGRFGRTRNRFLPGGSTLAALILLLAACLSPRLLLLGGAFYLAMIAAGSVAAAMGHGLSYAPAIAAAFVTIHAGVFFGSIVSALEGGLFRRGAPAQDGPSPPRGWSPGSRA